MIATAVSLAFGDIELLIMGTAAPSAADWDAHCRRVQQAIASQTLGSSVVVVSDGGAPSAGQRKQFLSILMPAKTKPARIAVCTSSVVARGVMTAFSWFGVRGLRAFLFHDLAQAHAWLGSTRVSFAELEAAIDKVQAANGWRRRHTLPA